MLNPLLQLTSPTTGVRKSNTKPPIELNKPIVSMPLSILKSKLKSKLPLSILMHSNIFKESLILSSSCSIYSFISSSNRSPHSLNRCSMSSINFVSLCLRSLSKILSHLFPMSLSMRSCISFLKSDLD
ncbi:hypothetical protein HPHPP3_0927 [Helicobacter pylori Hp P-3]|nr:hypothetical protein HPHPP3_0927 [Helicobacter pylori Hp P-3]